MWLIALLMLLFVVPRVMEHFNNEKRIRDAYELGRMAGSLDEKFKQSIELMERAS